MKADIKHLIDYGCLDDDMENNPDLQFWFEKSSCKSFKGRKLIKEFGYENIEDIINSGWFIPVILENETVLAKQFINQFSDEDIKYINSFIQSCVEEDDYSFFGGFFKFLEYHDYPKLLLKWFDFSDKILLEKAKVWCAENNIQYYGEYDPDRILELNPKFLPTNGFPDSIALDDPNGPKTAKFYYSKKKYMMQLVNYILEENGWISEEQIKKSDDYICPPEDSLLDLVKSFIKLNHKEDGYFFLDYEKYSKELDKKFYDWIIKDGFYEEWEEYQRNISLDRMIVWCKENNIKYCIASDKPDHFGNNI